MKRLFFLIFIAFSLFTFGHQFDRDQWNSLKKEMNYEKNPEPEEKEEQEEETYQNQEPASDPVDLSIPNEILYIIIGVILIGLILILVRQFSFQSGDQKIKKAVEIHDDIDLDQVQKSELELSLDQALEKEDFRLAIRILFLIGLKSMYDNHLVQWKKRKTNYTYAQELKQPELQRLFLDTVRIYEIAWYGRDSISETEYEQSKTFFSLFQKNLSNLGSNG